MKEDKISRFYTRKSREMFNSKTPIEDLPLRLEYGSSTHHPDKKGGYSTSDIVFWMQWADRRWIRPKFSKHQIISFIEICNNDIQVQDLMDMMYSDKTTFLA